MNDDSFEFGINGFGNTVEGAKDDLVLAYTEMKQLFLDQGKNTNGN